MHLLQNLQRDLSVVILTWDYNNVHSFYTRNNTSIECPQKAIFQKGEGERTRKKSITRPSGITKSLSMFGLIRTLHNSCRDGTYMQLRKDKRDQVTKLISKELESGKVMLKVDKGEANARITTTVMCLFCCKKVLSKQKKQIFFHEYNFTTNSFQTNTCNIEYKVQMKHMLFPLHL